MDKREVIGEIESFLRSGEKAQKKRLIGVEVEHFIINNDTKKAVPYLGKGGIEELLQELSEQAIHTKMENQHILGLEFENYEITLEPGAQIEISMHPMHSLQEVERVYAEFRIMLEEALKKRNAHAETVGYLPYGSVEEIEIIPGNRYHALHALYQKTGTMGRNMMRGTASVQFSVDYYSEQDFRNKYRLAYLLSPALSLLSFNSLVFEAKKNTHYLLKNYIWAHTDPARTGIIPTIFEEDFGYRSYAEYACSTPLYYETEELKEMDAYLAETYPHVRTRGNCLELRFADSMPIKYALSYVAFVLGLIESEEEILSLLKELPYTISDIEYANEQVDRYGYRAMVYGQNIGDLLEHLLEISRQNLPKEHLIYLREAERLIRERKTIPEIESELLC